MLTMPPLLPLKPFTCRLPKRALIRISGKDAHEFLQGLFTNDANLLKPGGSQWGCFLYFPGRVMCDAYIYQARQVYQGQSTLLVDIHQDAREQLLDHFVEMKMRKKVKIEDVSGSLAVAACLERGAGGNLDGKSGLAAEEGEAVSSSSTTLSDSLSETFLDPRTAALFPPVAESDTQSGSAAAGPLWTLKKKLVPVAWAPSTQPYFPAEPSAMGVSSNRDEGPDAHAAAEAFRESPYKTLLIANGVAEGPQLFRDGKSLPFELNTDFLGGVHFHKGCYVGQELTHRTHVMLVTRKRTVPLYFPVTGGEGGGGGGDNNNTELLGQGLYVKGGKDKVGEVTATAGPYGLGLLRLRYVNKETRTMPDLTLKDGQPVLMHFPAWWPPKQIKKLLKNN